MRGRLPWIANIALALAAALLSGPHTSGRSQAQTQSTTGGQAQATDESAKVATYAESLAKFQMAWESSLNSRGASITLKETSREKANGETFVTYRILTTGLPKNETYDLLAAGFDYVAAPTVYGVKLDDRGQAICTGNPDLCGTPERPNDPIVLKVSAGLGEPKRFGLISHDRRAKAFVSVVPFPVTGSDAACSVGAILLTKNGEAVLVEGNGFAPDAEIHLEANSQGEVRNSVVNADDKGNFYQIELPYVEGKSSGTVKVTAQAKTCSPSLTLNWGTDSYRIQ